MKYEPLIVEEWDKCAAEKVMLVDDAYDPPSFSDENAGQLLELLQDGKRTRLVPDSLLDADTASHAIDDLSAGSYETDAVQAAYSAVYRAYTGKRDAKLDLDGHFKERKEAALEKLDGLVSLLKECKDLHLEFAGNETAEETFISFAPHVLFYGLLPQFDRQRGKCDTECRRASLDQARQEAFGKGAWRQTKRRTDLFRGHQGQGWRLSGGVGRRCPGFAVRFLAQGRCRIFRQGFGY